MRITSTTPKPRSIDELINPRLAARLDALDIRTTKLFAGKLQGERRSKRRGQSVEFDEHRQYAPGDDVRFIDWNVYARLDELVIKLFLEEQDLALHLVIDASPSMDAGRGEPNNPRSKRALAAEIAAALGYIGLMQQNRVAVSIFGKPFPSGLARLGDLRGRQNIQRLAAFLIDNAFDTPGEDRPAGRTLSLNETLRTIAAQRIGKGVTVILSDFFDNAGWDEGLKALAAAQGYDTYCVQTLSPGELDPETLASDGSLGVSGDVRLTDAETNRAKEVTVTPELIKRYKAALQRSIEQLRKDCLKREMDHVLARTDEPPDRLILETLRRHGTIG